MKTNTIYCGDCASVMAGFPENSVDLIYVDPPFFSNKQYEVIWDDGAEIRAFEDRWKGGIENYMAWMEPKLRECHRVLKNTGTMYLHCDWHANAQLRILMDRIFGENNFRNEIVWCYSGGGLPQKDFPRKHENILRYVKDLGVFNDRGTFNVERKPYGEMTQQVGIHSTYAKKYGDIKIDLERGTPVTDWWADVSTVTGWAPERLGYPTQKPEALLDRIIKTSSNPMDIVLDPMCGCGTAIASAQKLGRRWIGIDISPTACKLMVRRMRGLGVDIDEKDIIGLPKTLEEVKTMQPFEFQNWVCQKLMAIVSSRPTGDMGIDGWIGIEKVPLQVKQSENIGRNVVDNFETALRRAKKAKGVIVAFSFGKGAHEEVARAKNQEGLEIILRNVQELIEIVE
jgi:DNA modification methylase